ncbi:MAG: DUF4062 domain-containing protein [Kiritimatiellae bacterium]|nr:DUF4062 domain-containing protein [Kiritimatiellia bacterium]
MVPSVFISSTVEDLRHIRDAVRSTVEELGYRPIMSEYGEIGYMSGDSAEGSCYKEIPECQIMVVIIGKRYGSRSPKDSNLTITEKELETARKQCKHIITLVEREVLEFKKVYDANITKEISCPGMNNPCKTFEFINRISLFPVHNGIFPFDSVEEARQIIKNQCASLFYYFLQRQPSANSVSLQDIMNELRALQTATVYQKESDAGFVAAMRFLFDEANAHFRAMVQLLCDGAMEKAISKMICAATLDQFISDSGAKLEIKKLDDPEQMSLLSQPGLQTMKMFRVVDSGPKGVMSKQAVYAWCHPNILIANEVAKQYFNSEYIKFKRRIEIEK